MKRIQELKVPPRISIVVAGAGTSLIHALFSVPGASKVMEEGTVLHSFASIYRFQTEQGTDHEVAVSQEVADDYASASCYASNGSSVGIGITAALATNRTRRGQDHAYITIYHRLATSLDSFTMTSTLRTKKKHMLVSGSRVEQEREVSCEASRMLLELLLEGDVDFPVKEEGGGDQ